METTATTAPATTNPRPRRPRARAAANEPATNEIRVKMLTPLASHIEEVQAVLTKNDSVVISGLGSAIAGALRVVEYVRKTSPLHLVTEESSVPTSFESGEAGTEISRVVYTLSKTAPAKTGDNYSAPIELDPNATVPEWPRRKVAPRFPRRRRAAAAPAAAATEGAESAKTGEANAPARRRERRPRNAAKTAETPKEGEDGAAPAKADADRPKTVRRRKRPSKASGEKAAEGQGETA